MTILVTFCMAALLVVGINPVPAEAATKYAGGRTCGTGDWVNIYSSTNGNSRHRAWKTNGTVRIYELGYVSSALSSRNTTTSWRVLSDTSAWGSISVYHVGNTCV